MRARPAGVGPARFLLEDVVRVALEQLLERDPRLEPRQRRAHAVVDAAPEGCLAPDLAGDVEVVRIAKLPLVKR